MSKFISAVENDVQDRSSIAWNRLCEYIDIVSDEKHDECAPLELIGEGLFSEIFTLPESISKLTKVKKVWLYGSKLKRIPPEIGQMESLEYLDIYTSYNLFWLPYEITKCRNLIDTRASTRVFYGNSKNRKGFPRLRANSIKSDSDQVNCSVCGIEIPYETPDQYWISLKVATDVFPLLVNVCSRLWKDNLPTPAENHVQIPHKGGHQIPDKETLAKYQLKEELRRKEYAEKMKNDNGNIGELKLIKLIRKIWEK